MSNYKYHATGLIAEAFDEHNLRYTVEATDRLEELDASFPIDCGPLAHVKYISRDNDNDVAVRLFHLINCIPEEKHPRILEACNHLNNEVRFMKFYLDTKDNSVSVEYDIPVKTSDECLGQVAVELFHRATVILDQEYPLFMKALFTDEDLDAPRDKKNSLLEMLRRLEAADDEDEDDEDEDDEDEDDEDEDDELIFGDDEDNDEDGDTEDAPF